MVLVPEPGPLEEHTVTCCTVCLVLTTFVLVEVQTEIKSASLGRWNVAHTVLPFCVSFCTCLSTSLFSRDGLSALYMSVCNVLPKVVILLELEISDMCILISDLCNRFSSF